MDNGYQVQFSFSTVYLLQFRLQSYYLLKKYLEFSSFLEGPKPTTDNQRYPPLPDFLSMKDRTYVY